MERQFRGLCDWLTSEGGADAYAAKFSPAGICRWAHKYGDIESQVGRRIAVGPGDEVSWEIFGKPLTSDVLRD
jgi:hypothetical protein